MTSKKNEDNLRKRLDHAAQAAELAFWAALVDQLPECETGDLDAGASHVFSEACREVVRDWYGWNGPSEPDGDEDATLPITTAELWKRLHWLWENGDCAISHDYRDQSDAEVWKRYAEVAENANFWDEVLNPPDVSELEIVARPFVPRPRED